MTPSLKQVEGFLVIGKQARTQNCDEFDEKIAKIPGLWQQFNSSDLSTMGTSPIAVYSDFESGALGFYRVTVGVRCNHETPQSHCISVQSGAYLVFQNTGPMPHTVINTWKHIWDYFNANSQYSRNFISDFERYECLDQVAVYIGIQSNL